MQREYPFIEHSSCENDNAVYDSTIIKINQNSELIELKEENKEDKVCPYYLLEGDRYDSDYENTHVIKAEKGMSCFLGHYTVTPEEKDYLYITSGQMKKHQYDLEDQKTLNKIYDKDKEIKHATVKRDIKKYLAADLCIYGVGGLVATTLLAAGIITCSPTFVLSVGASIIYCAVSGTACVGSYVSYQEYKKEDIKVNTLKKEKSDL